MPEICPKGIWDHPTEMWPSPLRLVPFCCHSLCLNEIRLMNSSALALIALLSALQFDEMHFQKSTPTGNTTVSNPLFFIRWVGTEQKSLSFWPLGKTGSPFRASCPAVRPQILWDEEHLSGLNLSVFWYNRVLTCEQDRRILYLLYRKHIEEENSAQSLSTNPHWSVLLRCSTGRTFHIEQVTGPITPCLWDSFFMQPVYCRGKKHSCSFILLWQPLSRRQNPFSSISVADGLAKPTEKRLACNPLSASTVVPCWALSPACKVDYWVTKHC